jgi:hypothetical protein
MKRRQLTEISELILIGAAPAWLVVTMILATRAPSWWNLMMVPAWLLGLHLRNVVHTWFIMKRDCFQLSDTAAAVLAANNGTANRIRLVKGQRRRLPPRCMFIAAMAEAGQPVALYRGWLFFKSGTAAEKDFSKLTRPSFRCRAVR